MTNFMAYELYLKHRKTKGKWRECHARRTRKHTLKVVKTVEHKSKWISSRKSDTKCDQSNILRAKYFLKHLEEDSARPTNPK